jgi:hypothetical protein
MLVRRGGRCGRWPARWLGWAGALGGGCRGDAAARRVGRTARGPDLGLSGLSSGMRVCGPTLGLTSVRLCEVLGGAVLPSSGLLKEEEDWPAAFWAGRGDARGGFRLLRPGLTGVAAACG